MSIEFIETVEQFVSSFKQFKQDSKLHIKQSIYHIGLDCEYIAKINYPESFKLSTKWTKKTSYDVATCILQIANEKTCLVIDLTKLGPDLPSHLIEIIKSDNWIKTGVAIGTDITYLSDNFDLGQCNGAIDVKHFAELAGCATPNLEYLNNTLGFTPIDKSIIKSRCDWSQPLTIEHLKYASNDAYASYNLGKRFITDIIGSMKKYFVSDEGIITSSSIKLVASKIPNYVGTLQEHAQKNKLELPVYVIEILDINKFKCTCQFLDHKSTGEDTNKQSSKSMAAKKMLELLGL